MNKKRRTVEQIDQEQRIKEVMSNKIRREDLKRAIERIRNSDDSEKIKNAIMGSKAINGVSLLILEKELKRG